MNSTRRMITKQEQKLCSEWGLLARICLTTLAQCHRQNYTRFLGLGQGNLDPVE